MGRRKAVATNWWGDGPPPWERWPGASLRLDDAGGRYHFDAAAADQACDFFPTYLRHVKGDFAGQPFELLPWQRDLIVRPLFGWKRADGTRRFRKAFLEVGKKNGKALALDTPIPTPHGWSTMGELRPGDLVFGADGRPVRVLAATEVMCGHECFRVCFSDGTSVVADAEHLWNTEARSAREHEKGRVGRIRTTREIAASVAGPCVGEGVTSNNHRIPVAAPLALEPVGLPVPPYTLGVWLGDGDCAGSTVTINERDIDIMTHVLDEGVPLRENAGARGSYRFRLGVGREPGAFDGEPLQRVLRELGLLRDKHIPAVYLRASVGQRLALLQGLMDTDGTVSRAGECEITTIYPRLRDGVVELLRSLGFKPSVHERRALLYGADCGPCYDVQFRSFADDRPVFRVPWKRGRLKNRPSRLPRSTSRYVVAVEPVASVPVRCIQVDAADGLFLAGDGMVPTHNSGLASGMGLLLAFGDDEPGAEVYAAAADRDQARIVFGDAAVMARENPDFLRAADVTVLRNAIVQTATNSTFKAVSSEVGTKHGFNVHGLIFDEFHTQRTRDLYDTLYKGTSARRQPIVFIITTAGDDRESICYEEYEYAKKVRDGVIVDEQYLPVIFESDPGADWTDERTWRVSNPSLGVTKSVEYMRAECAAARAEPRKRNSFLRLELNIWTESRTVWIAPEAWEACRRTEPAADLATLPCCAGMDLSASADLTAVVLAFRRRDYARPAETLVVELPQRAPAPTAPPTPGPGAPPGATPKVEHRLVLDYEVELVPYFFLPREVLHERARKDRVPYDVWAREGWLRVTEGSVVDYAEVYRVVLEEIRAKHKGLAQVGYDPWNANHLASSLTAAGVQMVEVRQGYASLSGPSKLFEALVRSRRIRQDGNPVMRWCVANCEVASDPAGNIKPVKPGGVAQGTRRIDGVVAAVTALSRLMVLPDRASSPYAYRGVRTVG
jgi:phage terminase large subunit-like protein